jgi:endonuclease-3
MVIEKFLKMVDILEESIDQNSPAFQLKNSYSRNPYTILMTTILSLRSRDEQSALVAKRLFNRVTTPQALLQIPQNELEQIIKPLGMQKKKAELLINISKTLIDEFDSRVPSTKKELLSIKGVGEKTANIVLNSAFGQGVIAVDTHLHRLCNMWGVIDTKTPEESSKVLNQIVPESYRGRLNLILVSFGQTICPPNSPKCNLCRVKSYCKFNLDNEALK